MCLVLICIRFREDFVIGSPFNVNWSLLFVFTFVIASCFVFFLCFCFLVLFVCVVFKVQQLRISIQIVWGDLLQSPKPGFSLPQSVLQLISRCKFITKHCILKSIACGVEKVNCSVL